jgi:hypothetical protein
MGEIGVSSFFVGEIGEKLVSVQGEIGVSSFFEPGK